MGWFDLPPARPTVPGLEKIKSVADFLEEENLRRTPLRYAAAPGDVVLPTDFALLVVDVQKEFCDATTGSGTPETEAVAKRIAELVPEFRAAGVPVYLVYLAQNEKKPQDIDFHQVTPAPGDTLVQKWANSAFENRKLAPQLNSPRRKTLLLCGFNLSACIPDTGIAARKEGFDVWVMPDLCGNDREIQTHPVQALQNLQDAGARFRNADDVLKSLPRP